MQEIIDLNAVNLIDFAHTDLYAFAARIAAILGPDHQWNLLEKVADGLVESGTIAIAANRRNPNDPDAINEIAYYPTPKGYDDWRARTLPMLAGLTFITGECLKRSAIAIDIGPNSTVEHLLKQCEQIARARGKGDDGWPRMNPVAIPS